MTTAVTALGVLAQLVAWWLVSARGASIWTTLAPVLAVAGALALIVGRPTLAGTEPVWLVVAVGGVLGLVLFAATRIFVAIVAPMWRALERDARRIYRSGDDDVPANAVLASAVVAVGEELFWRGMTQEQLRTSLGAAAAAAAAAWVGYVVVNAASRNLAIVAGALVGGAAWGALAWWSAGVLGSIACHATWTALMLARPPFASASSGRAATA